MTDVENIGKLIKSALSGRFIVKDFKIIKNGDEGEVIIELPHHKLEVIKVKIKVKE